MTQQATSQAPTISTVGLESISNDVPVSIYAPSADDRCWRHTLSIREHWIDNVHPSIGVSLCLSPKLVGYRGARLGRLKERSSEVALHEGYATQLDGARLSLSRIDAWTISLKDLVDGVTLLGRKIRLPSVEIAQQFVYPSGPRRYLDVVYQQRSWLSL
ncbi:hypothetical protein J2W27_000004 [Variovorax boronicumulans]|uniref:hypothetical protein n=1 Tax=Variovorax boronicumulans TaxID=436515 RepID=UPI002786DCAA|nr:hypothetical protein [Variovorax boronicumulans]MDP9907911.1 hypothetical protein [Variovorax boronicumulans]